MTKFDLIAVGDNATDAFIHLSEAELNCEIDKSECKICLKFASKIPYESVTEIPAGGNSSNVAMGAARLGLKVAFITNIGNDDRGEKTLNKLAKAGVDTAWVKKNIGIPTNYNYVLWYADDRTILVKHEDYPNTWPNDLPPSNWLYLSSINDGDFLLHQQIADWLTAHPETKLAFSPGTRQLKAGNPPTGGLKAIYSRTEILFCNKQEAEKIAGSAQDVKLLGPKTVIITNGENGASILDNDNNFYQIPIFSGFGPTFERTGAGDAFASAYLTATIAGLPAKTALAWGAINSASVITKIGPHEGLLTRAQIEEKLTK